MFHLSIIRGERKDEGLMRKVDPRIFKLMYNELLKQGVFIPPSQFETSFVSYSHNEEDIDQTIESYSNALRRVKENR
jgi:glutamate-1-semialdehyde 2,1-aminomutase